TIDAVAYFFMAPVEDGFIVFLLLKNACHKFNIIKRIHSCQIESYISFLCELKAYLANTRVE
ncbi:hypothetical protein ACJX0J_014346, partial [Zea mays]